MHEQAELAQVVVDGIGRRQEGGSGGDRRRRVVGVQIGSTYDRTKTPFLGIEVIDMPTSQKHQPALLLEETCSHMPKGPPESLDTAPAEAIFTVPSSQKP